MFNLLSCQMAIRHSLNTKMLPDAPYGEINGNYAVGEPYISLQDIIKITIDEILLPVSWNIRFHIKL